MAIETTGQIHTQHQLKPDIFPNFATHMKTFVSSPYRHGPEWYIQRDLKQFLSDRGWLIEQTHGNLYQQGLPDLFVAHRRYGQRWIDCKQPKRYSLTKAQRIKWPLWEQHGVGIWIITAATQEEYDKLMGPPNWRDYWKPSWGNIPNIDALLDELAMSEIE